MRTWFLMGSPWPIFIILALYLCFVSKLGPQYMKNQKAYNLKYVLIIYNIVQVVYNGYMWTELHSKDVLLYYWRHSCTPLSPNPLLYKFCNLSWHFAISKFLDLFDTVFFVLRKKQSQVTFLHVYHHILVLVWAWFHLKYFFFENAGFLAGINVGVHVIMYTYYLFSALGPQFQKYLWWKKHLTKVQMGQFVIDLGYLLALYIYDCKQAKGITIGMLVTIGSLLILFSLFYYNSYIQLTKTGSLQIETNSSNATWKEGKEEERKIIATNRKDS